MLQQLFAIKPHDETDDAAETTSDQHYYSYSEYLKGHRKNDGDHAIVAIMR